VVKSPWLTIWTSPRETMARVVHDNHTKYLWIFATIYGFCALLNLFQSIALGTKLSAIAIVLLSIVFAPLWGWVSLSLWSLFVYWVGKLFKAKGKYTNIRLAYAWACVPLAFNIPLWLLMIFVFGNEVFLNFPDAELLTSAQVSFLFAILVTKVALAVWSLIIYIHTLAQVQNFSVLKSIGNIAVAGLILGLIFVFVGARIVHIMGHF